MEVKRKEESRAVIAGWLPGSKAEDYVVSAEITARKPFTGGRRPPPPLPKKKMA